MNLFEALQGIVGGQDPNAAINAAAAGGGGAGGPPAADPTSMPGQAAPGAGAPPAGGVGPAAAPGTGSAPPDMTSLYTKLLADQQRDRDFTRGATLLAAGLGPKSSRPALIQAGLNGGSGGDTPSSTIETLMKLQNDVAAKAKAAQQAARLPAIARQYGLDMSTVQYLNDSGKLQETLSALAKPDTEVVTRADGSKSLINKRTGAAIGSDLSPATEKESLQNIDVPLPGGGTAKGVYNANDPEAGVKVVPGTENKNAGRNLKTATVGGQVVVYDENDAGKPAIPVPGAKDPNYGSTTDQKEYQQVAAERAAAGKPAIPFEDWLTMNNTSKATKIDNKIGDSAGTEAAKKSVDSLFKQFETAESAGKVINQIGTARDSLNQGINSGSKLSSPVQDFRKGVASIFGIQDNKNDNTDAFLSKMKEIVLPKVKSLGTGNSISDADRNFIEQAVGGSLALTPATMHEILNSMERLHAAEVLKYQKDSDWFKGVDPNAGKYIRSADLPALSPGVMPPEAIQWLRNNPDKVQEFDKKTRIPGMGKAILEGRYGG